MEFTLNKIPPHHYHLGDNLFLIVKLFRGKPIVHIRRFKKQEDETLHPTSDGITLDPSVWVKFPPFSWRTCRPGHSFTCLNHLFVAFKPNEEVRLQKIKETKDQFIFTRGITVTRGQLLFVNKQSILRSISDLTLGPALYSAISAQLIKMNIQQIETAINTELEAAFTKVVKRHFGLVIAAMFKNFFDGEGYNSLNEAEKYKMMSDKIPVYLDVSVIATEFCKNNIKLLKSTNLSCIESLCNAKNIFKKIDDMYIKIPSYPFKWPPFV